MDKYIGKCKVCNVGMHHDDDEPATNKLWRITSISEDGMSITLTDKNGHSFNTNKYLMVNYSHIGTEF